MKNQFSNFKKGDMIYFVRKNIMGNKEIKYLKVMTIYPAVMIAVEERGMSQVIGTEDIDNIYFSEKDAKEAEI